MQPVGRLPPTMRFLTGNMKRVAAIASTSIRLNVTVFIASIDKATFNPTESGVSLLRGSLGEKDGDERVAV
jgi:hypothetical protein